MFHNDVIAVGNGNVLLCHALAFHESKAALEVLKRVFRRQCREDLVIIEVGQDEVSVSEAVESYLFNSQLVTLPDGSQCLVAPAECSENRNTMRFIETMIEGDNPVHTVKYVDVRQSMKNGGGPACLRLRVVLTEEECAATHQGVFLTEDLYNKLVKWGERHFREDLHVNDLVDPHLVDESRTALDELTRILGLGPIYPFQKSG